MAILFQYAIETALHAGVVLISLYMLLRILLAIRIAFSQKTDRMTARRSLAVAGVLWVILVWLVFIEINMYLTGSYGGAASAGKIEMGRYYVGLRGEYTQVSKWYFITKYYLEYFLMAWSVPAVGCSFWFLRSHDGLFGVR